MAIKQIRLHTIFISYLVLLCLGVILAVVFFASTFQILIDTGAVLPANYTESLIAAAQEKIKTAEHITKENIPEGCEYAIFDKSGTFLSGSINVKEANEVWRSVTGENSIGGVKHYTVIKGKNESCILQYYYLPQYKSQILRSYLPNPQGLMFILFGVMVILEILFLSVFLGKSINKRLGSLKNAARKIQEKDLEFSIENSGIKEIDEVLASIDNMRMELRSSLKEQWELEQTRKQQISALAHDIKTPLTIIKGNSELLMEGELKEEEQQYAQFILKNAKQIEEYVKTVIEISNTEKALSVQIRSVDCSEFVAAIHHQLTALANPKNLQVEFFQCDLPERWNMDEKLLYRAVMNVISNGVEYCPEGGKIAVEVKHIGEILQFKIADSGKGFSSQDIKMATKQFYMGDTSRTSKSHYGMGLYIAENIVKQHKGKLAIGNSESLGGGEVSIEIPISFHS